MICSMRKDKTEFVALLLAISCLASACAEMKDAGRTIGHTARNVTREIGHGSREVAKAVSKGAKKVVTAVQEDDEKKEESTGTDR